MTELWSLVIVLLHDRISFSFSASCLPGMYFVDDDCKNCPVGFYQEEAGQFSCKACPVSQTTAKVGQISKDSCVCKLPKRLHYY